MQSLPPPRANLCIEYSYYRASTPDIKALGKDRNTSLYYQGTYYYNISIA